MALTSQQFAEVVAALRSSADRSKGSELRTTTRIEVNNRVLLWPVAQAGKVQEGFSVLARDISLKGIGLLVSTKMNAQQRFIVGLPRGRQQPILVGCVAMHVRELADGLYAVGASFENVIARDAATTTSAAPTRSEAKP